MFLNQTEMVLLDFRPEHQAAFRALNERWISEYFTLEPLDQQMLNDPQGYILDAGGQILMAEYQGHIVGTCALLKEAGNGYELAKMAVDPAAQGLGIGEALGRAAIARAAALGAEYVNLVSNRRLTTALALYRKLGFGEVPATFSGYARADIQMRLGFAGAWVPAARANFYHHSHHAHRWNFDPTRPPMRPV